MNQYKYQSICAYLANQIENTTSMALQEDCQNQAGHKNGFHFECIQLGIVSGTVLLQHGVNDEGLGADEENFHYQIVELNQTARMEEHKDIQVAGRVDDQEH